MMIKDMEKKYTILESSDVDLIDFNDVIEDNKNTLRYNLDKTSFIVKFTGETPDFLIGKTYYSHTEILEIINNPDNGWVINE